MTGKAVQTYMNNLFDDSLSHWACGACHRPIGRSDGECPHCGAVFVTSEELMSSETRAPTPIPDGGFDIRRPVGQWPDSGGDIVVTDADAPKPDGGGDVAVKPASDMPAPDSGGDIYDVIVECASDGDGIYRTRYLCGSCRHPLRLAGIGRDGKAACDRCGAENLVAIPPTGHGIATGLHAHGSGGPEPLPPMEGNQGSSPHACPYCDDADGIDLLKEEYGNNGLYLRLDGGRLGVELHMESGFSGSNHVKVKYCPMCGRLL